MEGYIAQIIMFGGNFAPQNWAFCQGQLLNIAQNTALFALLGTTYGGNGQTNFALPDFIGRTPIGTGQGPGLSTVNLGQQGGASTVTLTLSNLPAHNHSLSASISTTSANGTIDEPSGFIPAGGVNIYAAASTNNSTLAGLSANIGNQGGNQPVNIRQPYIVVNFVICLTGIFPSRN